MIKKLLRKKSTVPSVSKDIDKKQQRFDTMVRELHADLYRYAYWLCGSAAQADDLVQETFLRAWRALDSLKEQKAAKSWLITILRRENARLYERYTPEFVELEDNSSQVDAEHNTEQYALRHAIKQLEPDYREPLVLQIVGGFSGEEIAGILNLNVNTVSTRLFRARNKLKKIVHDDDT